MREKGEPEKGESSQSLNLHKRGCAISFAEKNKAEEFAPRSLSVAKKHFIPELFFVVRRALVGVFFFPRFILTTGRTVHGQLVSH